jgi:hypothetical protein
MVVQHGDDVGPALQLEVVHVAHVDRPVLVPLLAAAKGISLLSFDSPFGFLRP